MFHKRIVFFISFFLIFSNIYAKGFQKQATNKPILIQYGKQKHWCPICGMSIKKFYKTSYTSKLQNGKKRQYCSIRCLAVDMQEYNININSVTVIDAKTEKLINAKEAFYVVDSKVKGTMSRISKLAFKRKKDALEFIKKYKGKLVNFNIALTMAQKSLQNDIAMIQKKKQKKIYPMGKRIYNLMCNKNIDLSKYIEINNLKANIKNKQLCLQPNHKSLNEKQLQIVSVYLWEVKRFGDINKIKNKISVTKNEKCPVCGMFVYKYPKWVAQIFYKHNNHIHHYSFDGVKDLMKFYFEPNSFGKYSVPIQNITKILVTDYYSQQAIDGIKAFYVSGSDIYGPMGNELIPFKNKNDANIFKKDHYGKKIIQFKNISKNDIYNLDNN